MVKAITKRYTLEFSCKCPCTLPHSYDSDTALFWIKSTLCETNNILCSKNVENCAKWMLDFEKTIKINIRSPWTVFEISLTSAVISN